MHERLPPRLLLLREPRQHLHTSERAHYGLPVPRLRLSFTITSCQSTAFSIVPEQQCHQHYRAQLVVDVLPELPTASTAAFSAAADTATAVPTAFPAIAGSATALAAATLPWWRVQASAHRDNDSHRKRR